MDSKIISIAALAAAAIAGFLVFYHGPAAVGKTPIPAETSKQANTRQKWETKTDDRVSVAVVITPLDLSPQSAEWKFDVGMNTHSVELDQDMTKSAVLIDDKGKEYKPVKWEGPVGGHHREGVLSFKPVIPASQSIQLKLLDIGGVDRNFIWQLR